MIISRTPFRISLFGGGTDYPAWYRKQGGEVLATTIDKYCYLTCRYLPPFFEHRIRLVYSKIENCHSVDEIAHPAVRSVLRHLKFDRGLELHHDADLPARSGMGSSSAFTVGLLHALYALQGQIVSKRQLAQESIHIEQDMLQETVGCQDQILAAYGGFNHIAFQADGEGVMTPFVVKPLWLGPERVEELRSHLMLFYTGIKRTASTVAESYIGDIERHDSQLRALRDMVRKAIVILSGRQEVTQIGELLHDSWMIKRSLSPAVANPEVDGIYEQARAAGAIGGKVLGAGGGGFMLFFAPPIRQKTLLEKLSKLIHVPIRFETQGSQIVFNDPEQDYSDEERARVNRPAPFFREL